MALHVFAEVGMVQMFQRKQQVVLLKPAAASFSTPARTLRAFVCPPNVTAFPGSAGPTTIEFENSRLIELMASG